VTESNGPTTLMLEDVLRRHVQRRPDVPLCAWCECVWPCDAAELARWLLDELRRASA